MDKRTATISFRLPADLEHQLQELALAYETTVSDLVCHEMQAYADREFARYLRFRRAFEGRTDIPGLPTEHDKNKEKNDG